MMQANKVLFICIVAIVGSMALVSCWLCSALPLGSDPCWRGIARGSSSPHLFHSL